MKRDQFNQALTSHTPPDVMPELLRGLWCDYHGNWDEAHSISQRVSSEQGSALHAYLHRVEGNLDNARYWYNRAGRSECTDSLREEFNTLADEFCE